MVPSHRFGRFEVRPVERRLLIDGQPVALGARAFDVLLALIERRGALVTKNELLDAAWPGLVVEEANVQVQISMLRKVLGNEVMATVPGLGYRFAVPLLEQTEAAWELPPPAPARTLFGRDVDLQALHGLLERARLVTVVGPGGIGKTMLARALWTGAAAAVDADKTWVDLAPLADPALVVASLLQALQLGASAVTDPLTALLTAVQARRLLLVLDNAEHLADEVARLAGAIHEHAPSVRMVVTSQCVLKVAGEQVYRLGPLALPPPNAPLHEALAYGALALLAHRARESDRGFVLSEANLGWAVQLCRRLDGVPLAIELAAARVSLLGLQGVAQRLDECLRLLGGGPRAAPARQRTLHAALQWSHDQLGPAEQVVFRRCAIFTGGFKLDLLEAVAADEDGPEAIDRYVVVEALGNLVDHSLVSVDTIDPPRYRLLEPARLFAMECLRRRPEEAARIGRRHAEAMCKLFERADREWWKEPDEAWVQLYGQELDNLRSAIEHCIAHAEHDGWPMRPVDTAVALTGAASYLFWHLELAQELRQRLAAAYCLLDERTPPLLAARVLRTHAMAVARSGQLQDAMPLARRSLELARSTGSAFEIYQALWVVVLWAQHWEPTEELLACCDEMCRIEDPAWPPKLLQKGADAQAFASEARGCLHGAWQARERQVELAKRGGSERFEALAKFRLIELSLALGRVDDAVRCGQELVQSTGVNGLRRVRYLALSKLCKACLAASDGIGARAAAEEFLSMSPCFDGEHIFLAIDGFAWLAAMEGRWLAATQLLGYADHCYAVQGMRRGPNDQMARGTTWQLLSPRFELGRLEQLMAEGAHLDRAAICEIAMGKA